MRLAWRDGAWAEALAAPGDAAVVDSFLVDANWVRDLDGHERRFSRSCTAVGLTANLARLTDFLAAARRRLPRHGRWFPRLEAHPGAVAELVCWVRPAPPAATEIRLRVHPRPDPRRCPRVKGPDLALLAGLREQARRHGADDAVLLDADGAVLEAAHSGLLWWRGNTLFRPDPELPVLPSVTAGTLLARAREYGFEVVTERCEPAALLDAEVWAVNALHGILSVTGWSGPGLSGEPSPADRTRLARFRAGWCS